MPENLYILTSHAWCKILTVVFGFITTICSYYASEDSPWIKEGIALHCEHIMNHAHAGELVKWKYLDYQFEMKGENCVSPMTERLANWSLLMFTTISALLLWACCYAHIEIVNATRRHEAAFHILVAVTHITIGLVLVIYLSRLDSNPCKVRDLSSNKEYRGSRLCSHYLQIKRKYGSAGLCIGLGATYLMTAFVIYKVDFSGIPAPDSHNARLERDVERRIRNSESALHTRRISRAGHGRFSYESVRSLNTRKHISLPKPNKGSFSLNAEPGVVKSQ